MDKTTNVTHSSISPSSVSTQFAKFCESATDQQILNLAPANLDYIQTGQKIYFSPDGKIGPDSYVSRKTTSHEYRNLENLSAFIVRLEKAFVNSNSFYELDDIREKLDGAKVGLILLRADYEKSYPEGDAGRAPRLDAIDAALKNIDTLNTTFDSKFHLKSPDLGSSQLGSGV